MNTVEIFSNCFGRKIKIWNPTPEQEKEVRQKWALFHSLETLTTDKIIKKYNITRLIFERWAVVKGVKAMSRIVPTNSRDYSQYQRVPVSDKYGRDTYLLIPPGRDIKQAIDKYNNRAKAL
jgi:hypothetical protein